jgi:hypothetical protein
MNEALYYAQIARTDYPEEYADIIVSYGADGPQIAAETVYVYEHGVVPAWALHIEAFEMVGDSYLFIHRDNVTS